MPSEWLLLGTALNVSADRFLRRRPGAIRTPWLSGSCLPRSPVLIIRQTMLGVRH